MKKIHYLLFLIGFALAITACKSKQELVKQSAQQEKLAALAAESKLLFDQSGLDPNSSEKLAETMQSINVELADFLATDPDADARRAMLKKMMAERNQKIKSNMTDEQYKKYMEALRQRSLKISETTGAPAKDSGK